MATGYTWEFTVLPVTIDEITLITSAQVEIPLQRDETSGTFYIDTLTESSTVTITSVGYYNKSTTVGTSSITLDAKPNRLYAYTDANYANTKLYAWSTPYNTSCLSTVYTDSADAIVGERCRDSNWEALLNTYSTIQSRSDTNRVFTWEDENLTAQNTLIVGIAKSTNLFLTVGTDGSIGYSTDGTHWETRSEKVPIPSSSLIIGICYNTNNNKFYILYTRGEIYSTVDGTSFTQETSLPAKGGLNAWWTKIQYGKSKLAAICSDGSVAVSSDDGVTWTTQQNLLGSHSWNIIGVGGSYFIAIGSSKNMSSIFVSKSTDGITWDTPVEIANIGSHNYTCIRYNSQTFNYTAFSQDGYYINSVSQQPTQWGNPIQNSYLGDRGWNDCVYDYNTDITTFVGTILPSGASSVSTYICSMGVSNSTYKNYSLNLTYNSTKPLVYIRNYASDIIAPETIYTSTDTPSVGDLLYDTYGNPTNHTITSISGNDIDFIEEINTDTVNFTFTVGTGLGQNVIINGETYTAGDTVRLVPGTIATLIFSIQSLDAQLAVNNYAIGELNSATTTMEVYSDGVVFPYTTSHYSTTIKRPLSGIEFVWTDGVK